MEKETVKYVVNEISKLNVGDKSSIKKILKKGNYELSDKELIELDGALARALTKKRIFLDYDDNVKTIYDEINSKFTVGSKTEITIADRFPQDKKGPGQIFSNEVRLVVHDNKATLLATVDIQVDTTSKRHGAGLFKYPFLLTEEESEKLNKTLEKIKSNEEYKKEQKDEKFTDVKIDGESYTIPMDAEVIHELRKLFKLKQCFEFIKTIFK